MTPEGAFYVYPAIDGLIGKTSAGGAQRLRIDAALHDTGKRSAQK
jgi:hypothetical protein